MDFILAPICCKAKHVDAKLLGSIMPSTPRNYWMVVVSPEYFEASRSRNFDVLGMGKAQKKRVQRMEVGDRVLFYVSVERLFTATATINSTYFEDHEPVWPASNLHEDYPWRVKLRPSVVPKENEYIDARLIAPRMQYVRKWTPEDWPMAFFDPLHLVPKLDFAMLEDEMRKHRRNPAMKVELDPDSNCALDRLPAVP